MIFGPKQGWRHLTSDIVHLVLPIFCDDDADEPDEFLWLCWWLLSALDTILLPVEAVTGSLLPTCNFLPDVSVQLMLPMLFRCWWWPFSSSRMLITLRRVRSVSSTWNDGRWRGIVFTLEPIGVTVVAGSRFTKAAWRPKASIAIEIMRLSTQQVALLLFKPHSSFYCLSILSILSQDLIEYRTPNGFSHFFLSYLY